MPLVLLGLLVVLVGLFPCWSPCRTGSRLRWLLPASWRLRRPLLAQLLALLLLQLPQCLCQLNPLERFCPQLLCADLLLLLLLQALLLLALGQETLS